MPVLEELDYDETDMTVDEFDSRMSAASSVRLNAILVEFHGDPDTDGVAYPHKRQGINFVFDATQDMGEMLNDFVSAAQTWSYENPPPPGMTRLFRGENRDNDPNGEYWTNSASAAAGFTHPGGRIRYLDLPTPEAEEQRGWPIGDYRDTGEGEPTEWEWRLPLRTAQKSQIIYEADSTTTQAWDKLWAAEIGVKTVRRGQWAKAAIQPLEFHGDKGSPGYSILHPATEKIPLTDPELLRAIDKWKGDPHPLHITAPDILNGAPPPEFPRKGFRKEMATILQAMHDHATPQPELFRGIFKRGKSLDAFEKEFVEGKTFSLGPRGFSSSYATGFNFSRPGQPRGASVLFVLDEGAKALPIEELSFTNPTTPSQDVGEAERITAGIFEVVSLTRHRSGTPGEYLQIIIRQREFIKPPTGGFK